MAGTISTKPLNGLLGEALIRIVKNTPVKTPRRGKLAADLQRISAFS
jgi:hypothetical protein